MTGGSGGPIPAPPPDAPTPKPGSDGDVKGDEGHE